MAIALTIAGSDSSGGAGIQADLKTFAVFGVWGASVVTAVTAQNAVGIRAIHQIPAEIVTAQLDAVFEDLDVSAVKIGMLGQRQVIEAVATALARRKPCFTVLDPVIAATSGAALLSPDGLDAILRLLLPLADLVTPNLMEAAALTGDAMATDEDALLRQATAIRRMGAKAVLMKGGHGTGPESIDVLVTTDGIVRFARPRIPGPSARGTGCMLSAAIAADVANGRALVEAIEAAKNYVTARIAASGGAHGRVHGGYQGSVRPALFSAEPLP
jgi:hydroxymethylpyrimidine/phosphomethylpyrimidine kinase